MNTMTDICNRWIKMKRIVAMLAALAKGRRIVYGAGLITLVLVAGVVFWLLEGTASPKTASLATLDVAELRIKLPWNGETIEAAAPATLPQSLLESREYRTWQRVGNITELVGTDQGATESSLRLWVSTLTRKGFGAR